MLRAFGAFLVVFSMLSLVVQLEALGAAFAVCSLCFFAIDPLLAELVPAPRSPKMRGETLL
jgi:hypothetical protein